MYNTILLYYYTAVVPNLVKGLASLTPIKHVHILKCVPAEQHYTSAGIHHHLNK